MNDDANKNNLETLLRLFFTEDSAVGSFESPPGEAMPDVYRRLLDHEEHMTVAVEAYHESLVDVEVLETSVTETHYARRIVLRRQDTREVVQWGLMRIHLPSLDDEVRQEVVEQHRPLGRILVRHNFLRTIHLDTLWKIETGAELCEQFGLDVPQTVYGRTADIHLNGQPAVEVLEILPPLE